MFLMVLAAVAVVAVLVAIVLFMDSTGLKPSQTSEETTNQQVFEMAEEPVSPEGDIETIEAELDSTLVGELEAEFSQLEEELEGL